MLEETIGGVNVGYAWRAMLPLICMSCVVGGRLLEEVRRMRDNVMRFRSSLSFPAEYLD